MFQKKLQVNAHKPENLCYEVLRQVGLQGNYQTFVIIFCSVICFSIGFIMLGSSYYFAIPSYTNCPAPYQGVSQCKKYVCSLPKNQRAQFQQPEVRKLKTLGNDFGDLHCENQEIGEIAKTTPFIGTLVGIPIIGILADNLGRRFSIILCLGTGVLGYFVLVISQSLTLASIGLCIVSFGIESSYSLILFLVSQILQNSRRQKILILIQAFFCVGGLIAILVFYLIKQWRLIFMCFGLIPTILCFVFNYYYIKETPLFLIKCYSIYDIRESLRFIAKRNGKEEDFECNEKLSQSYILSIKNEYQKQVKSANSQILTFADLFRFSSVRGTTICLMAIFFLTNFLYYGPAMLINEFGFNFYINGVIINISELITNFFSYKFIEKIERRFFSIILITIVMVCSFGLIFLHKKQICTQNCVKHEVILQLVLVFIMRFCVSLFYQVLSLYCLQLYPVQIASLGLAAANLIGSIATLFVSSSIAYLNKINFSIMVLFTILSFLMILFLLPLRQTFGEHPRQRVQEIEFNQEGKYQMNFQEKKQ